MCSEIVSVKELEETNEDQKCSQKALPFLLKNIDYDKERRKEMVKKRKRDKTRVKNISYDDSTEWHDS